MLVWTFLCVKIPGCILSLSTLMLLPHYLRKLGGLLHELRFQNKLHPAYIPFLSPTFNYLQVISHRSHFLMMNIIRNYYVVECLVLGIWARIAHMPRLMAAVAPYVWHVRPCRWVFFGVEDG